MEERSSSYLWEFWNVSNVTELDLSVHILDSLCQFTLIHCIEVHCHMISAHGNPKIYPYHFTFDLLN